MLLPASTEIERLFRGKSQRLQLTDSLHDFFAINPKYYNNESKNDNVCEEMTCVTKCVQFADDGGSENGMVLFHQDNSSSTRSLTSIPEESIGLDRTQHTRRPSSDFMHLDRTDHHRKKHSIEVML